MKEKTFSLIFVALLGITGAYSQGISIDHRSTDLSKIPAEWIIAAKSKLHIAYGHTSHGSQLTEGMKGLVSFTGGKGGPQFAWNKGGTSGALDLHDYAMDGDCGYYPQWVNNTRTYLNNSANAQVNVIIWSWCGQISTYTQADLITKYIDPMCQLEKDYPKVKFVYMTGHLNYASYAVTTARNQQLRDFCSQNNKILFDFADIESYDPDGVYYKYANDNCDYFNDLNSASLGNWAQKWQNSHTKGIEWYECSSAHSQALNANQKAYAAWNLWARLAGWNQITSLPSSQEMVQFSIFPNPVSGQITISAANFNLTSIQIFNVAGVVVCSESVNTKVSDYKLDISSLLKGLYLVRISDGENCMTEKIVIQ